MTALRASGSFTGSSAEARAVGRGEGRGIAHPQGLSLIPSSLVAVARDEADAASLLREAGVDEAELDSLVQQLLDGRLLLVRREQPLELDELTDVAETVAPRLAELHVAG